MLNTSRVSPKSLASSVSPSTSPGNGTLMAHYAVESSKQLAAGILNLGDMGYKKLSKHYPELLPPDGPCSPGWKTGKLAASEPENAGLVSVKDLVSSEVISQFRAHTSPIAALCFDPSGTLLVTASVHGNNINIFRIMPSRTCNVPGCSGWSTSYVYLYQIYRGITTAVIQDICFSHDSQWIAIVSSKATCHIFVLSPFGDDDAFQALHTHGRGTSSFLASAPPWWSTSSFTINQQNYSPPPPCSLSPVCRIKCSDSGLLNSVSNVAASMVGKIWVPSGAVAATFHNSNSTSSVDVHLSATSLENLLVYSPSGFVIQHEIQSSTRLELSEKRSASWSAPQLNPQNEELHVKVERAQWWDVRRRLDNWEREECTSRSIFDGRNEPDVDGDALMSCQENVSNGKTKSVKNDLLQSTERSHWYLSNAEIRTNSRLPLWQMSKLHFHIMKPPKEVCYLGGEFEIEKVPSHKVQIRHKDLLPIFNNYPGAKPGSIDGYVPSEGRYSSDGCQADRGNTNEASIICHSNPPSFSSSESSEGGTEKTVDFGLFFKEGYCNKPEFDDHCKSTEVVTDEADAGGHSLEENPDEEGWIGGVFHFSEEARN